MVAEFRLEIILLDRLSFLKGVYVLVIRVDEDTDVEVGVLGRLAFKKGLYVYVGSAQNNLEKRVERHLRKGKRRFWHVDYLLDDEAAEVVEVFQRQADKAEECVIAGVIGERGVPVDGFGSSDCSCRGHLFRVEDCGFLQEFMQVLDVKRLSIVATVRKAIVETTGCFEPRRNR